MLCKYRLLVLAQGVLQVVTIGPGGRAGPETYFIYFPSKGGKGKGNFDLIALRNQKKYGRI